jgi:hypothetical protein
MKYETLREEILIEFEAIEMVVDEVNSLLLELAECEPSTREKAALSSFLMQFYNGIENILKRICKYNLIPLPKGDSWHIELFEKFCYPSTEPLPVLIDDHLKLDLISLRRFRHFVHHGYSFKIEWSRMEAGVKSIDFIYKEFKKAVSNYLVVIENR